MLVCWLGSGAFLFSFSKKKICCTDGLDLVSLYDGLIRFPLLLFSLLVVISYLLHFCGWFSFGNWGVFTLPAITKTVAPIQTRSLLLHFFFFLFISWCLWDVGVDVEWSI